MALVDERVQDAGRSGSRAEKYPSGVYIENRANISYKEMVDMPRSDGDLFALFTTNYGELRVEYSRFSDFSRIAYEQVLRRRIEATGGTVPTQDALVHVVALLMISRVHPYEFGDFIQLLDHDLNQLMDSFALVSWIEENQHLFASPVDLIADDDDVSALEREVAVDAA